MGLADEREAEVRYTDRSVIVCPLRRIDVGLSVREPATQRDLWTDLDLRRAKRGPPARRLMAPSSSRNPIATATIAVPSVASSSRTKADRKARRNVASVARRWRSATSRMIDDWMRAWPKSRSVGKPYSTSSKVGAEQLEAGPLSSCVALSLDADQRHE